jgi:hypothetical protein
MNVCHCCVDCIQNNHLCLSKNTITTEELFKDFNFYAKNNQMIIIDACPHNTFSHNFIHELNILIENSDLTHTLNILDREIIFENVDYLNTFGFFEIKGTNDLTIWNVLFGSEIREHTGQVIIYKDYTKMSIDDFEVQVTDKSLLRFCPASCMSQIKESIPDYDIIQMVSHNMPLNYYILEKKTSMTKSASKKFDIL